MTRAPALPVVLLAVILAGPSLAEEPEGHVTAGWGPRAAPWVFDFGGLSRIRGGVRWIPDWIGNQWPHGRVG